MRIPFFQHLPTKQHTVAAGAILVPIDKLIHLRTGVHAVAEGVCYEGYQVVDRVISGSIHAAVECEVAKGRVLVGTPRLGAFSWLGKGDDLFW
ncbi:hypothetical protein ACJZ2D_011970 [Fusarium nematophilum]